MNDFSNGGERNSIVTKKPTVKLFVSILNNVKLKEAQKVNWAKIVRNLILQSTKMNIGEGSPLSYIDKKPEEVQVSSFCTVCINQPPKIYRRSYSRILLVLQI